MSRAKTKKIGRRALLAKLWDLGRVMSTQTVFLHQAIAQSVAVPKDPTLGTLIVVGFGTFLPASPLK